MAESLESEVEDPVIAKCYQKKKTGYLYGPKLQTL